MKVTLIVLVVLILGLGAGAMVAGPGLMRRLDFQPQPRGTEVRLQTLTTGPLTEFISAPGEVEPRINVEISSEVSARIEEIPVKDGQEVRKGDVIVRLDDRDLKSALDSAVARRDGERYRLQSEQARLAGLLSQHTFAKRELERQQNLFETGDISRKALDDAEERELNLAANVAATQHSISVIESSLVGAEADITRARDSLGKTVITAPMDGVVTRVNMEEGEQVLGTFNNLGSQIMTIADLSRMMLKAEVAESDIAAVQEGQSAKIHINAYPDEVFVGTVTLIALQRTMSSDGTGIFEVEVEIDLQGRRIYSGLAANVDIEIGEHEGLAAESQAIVERLIEELPDHVRKGHELIDRSKRTTKVVYRMIDGKAVCTPVRPGPSDLTHTLVTAGLNEGDVIVVGPYKVLEKIKDGEAIRDEDEVAREQAGGSDDDDETPTDPPVGDPETDDEDGGDGEPGQASAGPPREAAA